MAEKVEQGHDELMRVAREKHGRVIGRVLSSGQSIIFRAPTKDEYIEFDAPGDKPRSARVKQLCLQTCVHPRSDDPVHPVDDLRAILEERPGIATAVVRGLLALIGDDVEFSSTLPLEAEWLRAQGAEEFGLCPDGEIVGVRNPTADQWDEFQDAKDERYERLEQLALATIVGDAFVLNKYPALVGQIAGAAIRVSGATLELTAKKG